MVCKIFFYTEYPDRLAEKREVGEEHKQLQSIVRFTQTQ